MSDPDELATLKQLQQRALIAEAEDAARGVLYLTVETGYGVEWLARADSMEEATAAMNECHDALYRAADAGRDGARVIRTVGGSYYTTFVGVGPGCSGTHRGPRRRRLRTQPRLVAHPPVKTMRLRGGKSMTKPAILITDAYPGTECRGLRHSIGHCTDAAVWVIHIPADPPVLYPVCDEHLRAFRRDMEGNL